MTETNILLIPDHRDRGIARLLFQFRDKPRTVALISALAAGVQVMEEIFFDLIVSRTLPASTGAQLDQWGSVVGEDRKGAGDADYRRFVEARILVNTCGGTTDEILAVWAKITAGTPRHRDLFPAGFQLETQRTAFMSTAIRGRVRRMMLDVKPAGVTMYRVEALVGGFGTAGGVYTGLNAGGLARSF